MFLVCQLNTRILFTSKTSWSQFLHLRFSSGYFPTEKIKNLQKDVLLYSLDKVKFLKYLSFFGVGQLFLCGYYASTFFSLRNTDTRHGEKSSWRNVNLSSFKSRMISAATCMGFGLLTAFISYSLPYRIVKQLTLHKGGDIVTILTYGPFGRTRQLSVPLRKISCMCTREEAKSYIPFKIKNKSLFFLIDCKGKFLQPTLYDVSVGTKSFKI
ncbi:transmembrane protein 223 [Parasteatoda tepidariorum]|nr:transmembrane protein 223 [Parasteatoda tepidariorum]